MQKITFEVCAGSYQDCLAAEKGGADRVELNSALSVGGLTNCFRISESRQNCGRGEDEKNGGTDSCERRGGCIPQSL